MHAALVIGFILSIIGVILGMFASTMPWLILGVLVLDIIITWVIMYLYGPTYMPEKFEC